MVWLQAQIHHQINAEAAGHSLSTSPVWSLHSTASVTSKVLLIGGANNSGPSNQILLLDTKTGKLELMKTALQEPRAKMNHIFIKKSVGTEEKIFLFIYGGSPISTSLEVFEYQENGLETKLSTPAS